MKYLLTLASVLLLFTACSSNSDDELAFVNTKASRAVIIYMAGENLLTAENGRRYLNSDLSEIIEGSKQLGDNQRVFVFVDSLGTNSSQKGTPYIIEVHHGKVYQRKQYDSDFYSCDPDRFREVVSWMTSNISADGYGLVLWGHASGWAVTKDSIATASRRAYGLDNNQDLGQKKELWMNITQMAEALKGLPKMDFIFADCCNMMSAEVGYELRNATDYLIGSPAEIPGLGAPYDKILPRFFLSSGSTLYRGIIDTYYDYYQKLYQDNASTWAGYSVPLSVIDTRYIAQLASSTRDVLTQFSEGYPSYPDAPDMRGLVFYFAYNSGAPMMYDMRGFIKRNVPASVFQSWDQVYSQAVPYYRMSMKWMTIWTDYRSANLLAAFDTFDPDASQYGCVSMYIPQNLSAYYSSEFAYNKNAANFGWNRVIDWSRFGW